MDEQQGAEQPGRDGIFAQRLVRRFSVRIRIAAASTSNVGGSKDLGFGDPDTGVRWGSRNGLLDRSWCQGGGFREALARIGGGVLAAASVDRLEAAPGVTFGCA